MWRCLQVTPAFATESQSVMRLPSSGARHRERDSLTPLCLCEFLTWIIHEYNNIVLKTISFEAICYTTVTSTYGHGLSQNVSILILLKSTPCPASIKQIFKKYINPTYKVKERKKAKFCKRTRIRLFLDIIYLLEKENIRRQIYLEKKNNKILT